MYKKLLYSAYSVPWCLGALVPWCLGAFVDFGPVFIYPFWQFSGIPQGCLRPLFCSGMARCSDLHGL